MNLALNSSARPARSSLARRPGTTVPAASVPTEGSVGAAAAGRDQRPDRGAAGQSAEVTQKLFALHECPS
ncbi:MAG: hypothetical protein IPP50_08765 [Piscinibacter sp.]|nr:hypothetical protein [Piscinibacter sp.]